MQSVTTKVKPIPEGYHSLTPIVTVEGAVKLIDFLKQVFNAQEEEVYKGPDGRVIHAELTIGDSILMLSDANPEFPALPAMINVYTEDVDAAYRRALKAGATSLREPSNQFYGDRTAGVKDAHGNQWWIATHVEDVSQGELEKRMKARRSQ
ncbi:MAG TPA: VOC family protein [Candidatus Bathyarchaeia archaeon]|nr:VOC family protein [Candidatus Bathyarchaeia archaeon]